MKTVIGIDVGGTTTKIVGFNQGELIEPLFVKSGDPITSIYGAFGKFTHKNGIALSDISRVMITGAGNAYVTNPIYGLDCRHVGEFGSVAKGACTSQALTKPSSSAWAPVRHSYTQKLTALLNISAAPAWGAAP